MTAVRIWTLGDAWGGANKEVANKALNPQEVASLVGSLAPPRLWAFRSWNLRWEPPSCDRYLQVRSCERIPCSCLISFMCAFAVDMCTTYPLAVCQWATPRFLFPILVAYPLIPQLHQLNQQNYFTQLKNSSSTITPPQPLLNYSTQLTSPQLHSTPLNSRTQLNHYSTRATIGAGRSLSLGLLVGGAVGHGARGPPGGPPAAGQAAGRRGVPVGRVHLGHRTGGELRGGSRACWNLHHQLKGMVVAIGKGQW